MVEKKLDLLLQITFFNLSTQVIMLMVALCKVGDLKVQVLFDYVHTISSCANKTKIGL